MAAPDIVRGFEPGVSNVVLAAGEAPDSTWLNHFRRLLQPWPVDCVIEPAVKYVSEQERNAPTLDSLRRFFSGLLGHGEWVVWAHNLGLGRNLPLASALQDACTASGATLVMHHHDWWFDNRWTRWAEMRRTGFATLPRVANAVFGKSVNCFHAAINQADARVLKHQFGARAEWLPNPGRPTSAPPRREVAQARKWLTARLGDDAPVWLMPCRLLRRKNVAEALLLARWLHPDARLVTTGGPSSKDEEPYGDALRVTAEEQGWRLHLSVLAGPNEADKPSVASLLECSEAVLLTSLQEGFGLPYLEATAARKPLLARALPNVMPDLAQLGFRFPHTYPEIMVDSSLFDLRGERSRQEQLYKRWKAALPAEARRWAGTPPLLRLGSGPVPFSRLTLTAQLELLSVPPEVSWAACAELNLLLKKWRYLAQAGTLREARWPTKATRRLEPGAYAECWRELLARRVPRPAKSAGRQAQAEFIRARVAADNLYPLLWS